MRAHEAGALHAEVGVRGPTWLRPPADVNALLSPLWPRTVSRGEDGALWVAGCSVCELAQRFGTPSYVLDETDLRARCRDFRTAFAGFGVFYAAKAFCCRATVRIIAEEGLNLDVCTGGELAVALAAGMPAERIKLHGNNKSPAELSRALDAGLGWIVVDSFDEIDRLTALARERGQRPRVMVRVTVGVEAHTHAYIATAHEDQKFGFSLAGGAAFAAVERILTDGVLELAGLHSHIGSQIFDASGFEVSARRVLGLHDAVRSQSGVILPELDLGGGFGIAYTSQDHPATPAELATRLTTIVEQECAGRGLAVPQLSIEPG
ncbi:MAG: diaminopimelate decarboxylase family protein, partial [Micromonosporaceae bacterium]